MPKEMLGHMQAREGWGFFFFIPKEVFGASEKGKNTEQEPERLAPCHIIEI